MKHIILAGLVSLSLVTSAQAGLITLTDSAAQTVDFENFQFIFAGLEDPVPGTGGTFELEVRGDFHSPPGESADFDLEGVISGNLNINNADSAIFDGVSGQQTLISSFSLTPGEVASLLVDNSLTIDIDFLQSVHDFDDLYPNPGVTVSFTYDAAADADAVPEPSTFALLGIGGLALVGYGWRRKRQQAA